MHIFNISVTHLRSIKIIHLKAVGGDDGEKYTRLFIHSTCLVVENWIS